MGGRLKEKDSSIKVQDSEFGVRNLIPHSTFRMPQFCCLLPMVCCLFLLSSCGTPYGIYHKVGRGQTLYSIAKTYDVSVQEIIKINGLKEPVSLRVGDSVFIPGAGIEKVVEAHKDDDYIPPPVKKKNPKTAEKPRLDVPKSSSAKAEKGRFIWPLEGKLISAFGLRNGEKHAGIDIKAETGSPVKAADSGKVIYSGDGLNGYGNLVIIKHTGTFFTVYAHNRKNLVSEGSLVEKGDVIAEVGQTGRATTPHLHFEIRKNKVTVDPILYLPENLSLVYK